MIYDILHASRDDASHSGCKDIPVHAASLQKRPRQMPYTADYAQQEPSRADIDALAGVTVVEFGAPWCGHCQAAQAGIASGFRVVPDARHVKIHDGRGQPLGRSFRVKLWPTLVFLRDGVVLARLVRPDDAEIVTAFASVLGEIAD